MCEHNYYNPFNFFILLDYFWPKFEIVFSPCQSAWLELKYLSTVFTTNSKGTKEHFYLFSIIFRSFFIQFWVLLACTEAFSFIWLLDWLFSTKQIKKTNYYLLILWKILKNIVKIFQFVKYIFISFFYWTPIEKFV